MKDKGYLCIQHLGYRATAFEEGGFIDFEEFKAYEIMEVLDTLSDDKIINLYNDFLSSNSDKQYFINDDDFLNEYFSEPAEAVRAAIFGNYRYNDEYVTFDDYANLKSCNDYDIRKEAERDKDFKLWLFDNYSEVDDLGEFIDYMNEHQEQITEHALKLVHHWLLIRR